MVIIIIINIVIIILLAVIIIIIIIIIYSWRVFHISFSWWSFTGFWVTASLLLSLDFEWQHVSWTLLSILAILNCAVVWMVSTCPPTCKSSSPFHNLLVTVLKAPFMIGTIVTFIFHSFFNSLARSRYLSFFSHSFCFILWSARAGKSAILQILFFIIIINIRSGLLAEIKC